MYARSLTPVFHQKPLLEFKIGRQNVFFLLRIKVENHCFNPMIARVRNSNCKVVKYLGILFFCVFATDK